MANKKKSDKAAKKAAKSSKSTTKTKTSLYDPAATLKGSDIRKLAKKLTNVSYNPQIQAAKSQKKSLVGLLNAYSKSNKALTNQASGDVKEYYKSLGDSDAVNRTYQEALGARLRGEVAQAGTDTQNAISTAAGTASVALSGEGELRRLGDTRASDELALMRASESSRASREAAALQSQASNQSAQFTNLQGQQARAAQSRGGAMLTDIGRQGQANEMELQSQYAPGIIDATKAVRQLKGDRGGARAQMIRQLIGEEREFGLSKAAVGVDKAGIAADMQQAKLSAKTSAANSRRTAATSAANSRRTAATSRANNAATNQRIVSENRKDRRADRKADKKEKRQEYKADVETARGKANTYVSSFKEDHNGKEPSRKQVFNYLASTYGDKVANAVVYPTKGQNVKDIAQAVAAAANTGTAVANAGGRKKRSGDRKGMHRP